MSAPITIILTLFIPTEGLRIWSNGGGQNVFNLAATLRAAGHRVIIANGGPGEPPAPDLMPEAFRDPIPRIADVIHEADLLIEAGAQVSAEHVASVRARGGKAVTLKFGNALAIDAERAIHNLPAGAIFNGARFDEVWTTTQHAETCGAYWEATYRCPVYVLPHVWAADFIDHAATGLPNGGRYQPGRPKKRVVIVEPNINLVKTAHVPMVIADLAWRERPDLIDQILVFNAQHLRDRLPFSTFANALDSAHAKAADGHPVMSFEARWPMPHTLATRTDVLVSHQWIAVPNYSHYDAMHLGYPIVHNVPDMPGHQYDGFNAKEGARELVDALVWSDRPDDAQRYRAKCLRFLDDVNARARGNVADHAWAVARVMGVAS